MAPSLPSVQEAAHLALFSHLVCRPEAELDLAQAALVLAEPEYPGLDIEHYLDRMEVLGHMARAGAGAGDPVVRARRAVRHLLDSQGFRGNVEHYDDPRNSFLNEVLDRHLGIPITLAVVMIEAGRRAELSLHGVSFPGHFLLRAGPLPEAGKEGPPAVYLDPFTGKDLGRDDLRTLLHRGTGESRDPTPAELQVATRRAILTRMLHNLRNIYAARRDAPRLRLAVERLRLLELAGRHAEKRPVPPEGLVH